MSEPGVDRTNDNNIMLFQVLYWGALDIDLIFYLVLSISFSFKIASKLYQNFIALHLS